MMTIDNYEQGISQFFSGKHVLVTGGTGFMGKVLIEKLLRSCPDIGNIYTIVREKRGVAETDRLKSMFELPLFEPLKKLNSKIFDKVVPISGNMMKRGLGISAEDALMLQDKVSVVFHVAASVRFDDPLKTAVLLNARGTRELVCLALGMKNISCFVYVSTAYSNCDRFAIDEVLYPAHTDWRKTIKTAEETEEGVLSLLSEKYIGMLPNTYVFSKLLAEHIVHDLCDGKIPAVIFRPSIVTSAIENPVPGWCENFNGPFGLLMGVGKGIIRTALVDPSLLQDYIAVDTATKALVIATWKNALEKKLNPSVSFYNCTSSGVFAVTMDNIFKEYMNGSLPMGRILWYPHCTMTPSYTLYYILVLLTHLLPAIVLDACLKISKQRPMFVRLQRKIFIANLAVRYFCLNQWTFGNTNFMSLEEHILSQDRKDWSFEFGHNEFSELMKRSAYGCISYLLKEDISKLDEYIAHFNRMYYVDRIVKVMFVFLLLWLVKPYITSMLQRFS